MSNLSKLIGLGVVEYFEDVEKMKDHVNEFSKKHDVSIEIIMEDLDTMLNED